MSMLEGFSAFNFEEGVPYVSVTINGVTFNRSVVMKLGYPTHARLLINEAEKKIAVQGCDEESANTAPFYKEKKSGAISVRWNGRDLLNTFQEITGWDLKSDAYRIEGTHLKAERAILFELNKATKL